VYGRIPTQLRQQPRGPVWTKSAGSTVWDKDGRAYLDMSAGFGVSAVGHSRREVIDAVHEQGRHLAHAMTTVFPHSAEEPALSAVAEKTGFDENGAVLLTSSGSDAVDVALRVAVLATGRRRLLAFDGGYHGYTFGALAATGQRAFREPFDDVIGLACTFVDFVSDEDAEEQVALVERQIRAELERGDVAALVLEPMQNIAGYRTLSTALLRELPDLCHANGALLIFDEVFTGFGRTGAWTLAQEFDVQPDLICVGKACTGGFPAGACVGDLRLLEVLGSLHMVPLHSPTFFVSPLAAAAVTATIQILRDEGLVSRARWIGEILRRELARARSFDALELRFHGRGAAQALTFEPRRVPGDFDSFMERLNAQLLAEGVIALRSGFPTGETLAFSPALTITEQEIARAAEALDRALTNAL
jgi:4-aminobutyrate aminotransferase-like enzyme